MSIRTILPGAMLLLGASALGVDLYPATGTRAINLRVPLYAAPDKGFRGDAMPFNDVVFDYMLAPHLKFSGAGRMDFGVRALKKPFAVEIMALEDARRGTLVLRMESARVGQNRCVFLFRQGTQVRASAVAPVSPGASWAMASVEWKEGKAFFTLGNDVVSIALPADFAPEKMVVNGWSVDEMRLKGDNGTFVLDWEKRTYAGKLDIARDGGFSADVMGFDSGAITLDRTKRECPVIHLVNTSDAPKRAAFRFSMKSEVAKKNIRWTQEVVVPAKSDHLEFIVFPGGLADDIHHLAIVSEEMKIKTEKHFLHILRRAEKAGPDKFGWHSCVSYLFGGYMDPIPVRIPVRYSHWNYVYAPFWLEDYRKNPAEMPVVPPESWNYEPETEWLKTEGRKFALCIQTSPGMSWGQEAPLDRVSREGGGGLAKKALFQDWFRVMVERYKDNVLAWEVENEPNAWMMPNHPQEYWKACQMVYEVVKSITPATPVYGICGTSIFTGWMDKALAAGAGKYLDGVSWHSYLIENFPEESGLDAMLKDAVKKFGGKPALNTETGCNAVMRYKIDEAIPPEEVKAKRESRVFGFAFPSGFPSTSVDEWDASNKIVRNVVVNFCSGAKLFTFFGPTLGRDPNKPADDWREKVQDFKLFASTPEGLRTPSLYLLAIAVCSAQLEGATLENVKELAGFYGVNGAIFDKAETGKVAVVWAVGNRGAVLLNADVPELEQVGIHGQRSTVKATGKNGNTYSYLIELDSFPRYLHSAGKRLEAESLPVEKLQVAPMSDTEGTVHLSLGNRENRARKIDIAFEKVPGVAFEPSSSTAELAPGAFRELSFKYKRSGDTGRTLAVPVVIRLDGRLDARLEAELKALKIHRIAPSGNTAFLLNRDEQVVIGHAPALASLAEGNKYWNGPEELSGNAQLSWDEKGFKVALRVVDKVRIPAPWPGIHGTSVELFLDLRTPEKGLGNPMYGKRVYQFLALPYLGEGEGEVKLYCPQLATLAEPGLLATGKRTAEGYEMTLAFPWKLANPEGKAPETFGFDLALNGAFAREGKPMRKTQIMLFGNAENARNAAAFGRLLLK